MVFIPLLMLVVFAAATGIATATMLEIMRVMEDDENIMAEYDG